MNRIYLFLFIIVFTSCGSSYLLNKKSIGCYWPKEDNFEISKLQVDTLGEKGYPLSYSKEVTYSCMTIKQVAGLDGKAEKIETLKYKPERKIHFRKKNNYYRWCKVPCDSLKITESLPLQFERNNWYELSGFPENNLDPYVYHIYFYVNEKGKMKEYHIWD